MPAGGAALRRLGPLVDPAAFLALPPDRLLPLVERAVLHAVEEPQVPLLMLHLDFRDPAKHRGGDGEPFLLGDLPERRVEVRPLLVLPGGGGLEVYGGAPDLARVPGLDLDVQPLEKFEIPLGVQLLVLRRLEEDRGDPLVPLFGSDPRVESVPVPRLRFAGERGHQVMLRARPFQLSHTSSDSAGILKRKNLNNYYREMPGDGATEKIDGRLFSRAGDPVQGGDAETGRGGQDDGRAGGGVEMPGGDDAGKPRQRGDSHGDPEGRGGPPGNVAGGGGGDDEQGGNQEDPHGVDRRGHNEGDDQREGDLHGRRVDSLRPCESLVDPQQQNPVVEQGKVRGNEQEKDGHPQEFGVGDGERVAVQKRLQVPRQPLLPADDRDPAGDDGREDDADDRVRRKFGASLYQGDGDGDDGAERGHRPGGGDAEEDPEGDAGEGGVADRVGEEG